MISNALPHLSAVLHHPSREIILDESFCFNGKPNLPGGNTIELLRFNSDQNKFEFREIDFLSGKARLSKINPSKCLECHGQDPKPIWHPYPRWPGAYAEARDGGVRELEGRQTDFEAFQRKHLSLPRYRFLPKLDQRRLSLHNVGLTNYLSGLNAKRVLRILEADPLFRSFLPAFIGASSCSEESPQEWVKKFLPQKFHADFLPILAQERKTYHGLLIRDTYNRFPLLNALFKYRGHATRELPTVFEFDRASLDPFGVTDVFQIDNLWVLNYPWVNKYYQSKWVLPVERRKIVDNDARFAPPLVDSTAVGYPCEDIQKESLELLNQLDLALIRPIEQKPRTPLQVLDECARCHVQQVVESPKFPMQNIIEFRTFLNAQPERLKEVKTAISDGEMPPSRPLQAVERELFFDFLEGRSKD